MKDLVGLDNNKTEIAQKTLEQESLQNPLFSASIFHEYRPRRGRGVSACPSSTPRLRTPIHPPSQSTHSGGGEK